MRFDGENRRDGSVKSAHEGKQGLTFFAEFLSLRLGGSANPAGWSSESVSRSPNQSSCRLFAGMVEICQFSAIHSRE